MQLTGLLREFIAEMRRLQTLHDTFLERAEAKGINKTTMFVAEPILQYYGLLAFTASHFGVTKQYIEKIVWNEQILA